MISTCSDPSRCFFGLYVQSVFALPKKTKQVQEEVDNVQVQGQSCEDVVVDAELKLVTAQLTQDHLSVEDDIHDKDHDTTEVVHHHHVWHVETKHAHDAHGEAKHHESHQRTKEVWTKPCEVCFCCPGIYGKSKEYTSCDTNA